MKSTNYKTKTIKTDTGEELILFQTLDNLWCCPACGSPELSQQPYREKGLPSFEICNCMFQIGYDDNPLTNNEAVEGIKNNWQRWRTQLLHSYQGNTDRLNELKHQLSFIGIEEPTSNATSFDQISLGEAVPHPDIEPPVDTNDHYHDPLLTRLYDLQNPWGPDYDFYLSLAQSHNSPLKVLDIGCGTGILTTAFAKAGHSVTGVDPAIEMLNRAIRKPNGDKVMWVKATAQSFTSEDRFDLIILSGHAFQVFLSDNAIQTALITMREHLAPSGRIAFEIRNPEVKAWQTWTEENTREHFIVPPSMGSKSSKSQEEALDVWHDIESVEDCGAGKLVRYNTLYRKTFSTSTTPINVTPIKTSATIRFLTYQEVLVHLDQAGLTPHEVYGDWNSSPLKPDSKEIIVVAELKPNK
ncbi:class I SAM-dependent DNA methyltransferase [Kiloniella antarctica]|uniref:Class I SAM-dependent DNA methyltransferase n=1 Tax=Kiloniella antarctica TaxID=1550907 RepID=A0ABW5BM75_9PROT